MNERDFQKLIGLVRGELYRAAECFDSFSSAHEGWAVIKEEVDELWDEVKRKQNTRSIEKMRAESVQIAAMAIRFALDICPPEQEEK